MAIRIVENQMTMTKPLDMAADRARDIRQSGLQTSTIHDMNKDTENTMHTIHDKPEVEDALVRTDSESESGGGQERSERERRETPETDPKKIASERLLNLPVTSRNAATESRGFDIRV